MEKIICGFAGIGKSYMAKKIAGVVDLESTPFNKNWELYVDVATHMAKNGYTVLLSCHKELRNELKKRGEKYSVAIPRKLEKNNYMSRYISRGNTRDFIQMMRNNFELFIEEIEKNEKHIIYIDEFISKLEP